MKKTTLHSQFISAIILTSLYAASFSIKSSAQEDGDDGSPRWYQVEMVIFSHNSPGSPQEDWPHDIVLSYPPNWVELPRPDTAAATDAQSQAQRYGTDTQTTGTQRYTDAHASEQAVDLATTPYYPLPDSEYQLKRETAALKRDSRYRVLFHKAWRQPVVDYKEAPAVLVDGGESYGNHRELEGSITLSVSRYLHLHTNLWLSRFKANYGQEFGDWPELPERPSLAQLSGNNPLHYNDPSTSHVNTSGRNNLGSAGLDHNIADLRGGRSLGLLADLNSDSSAINDYSSILSRPYIVDQVVTLKQQRKMRSGELHYVDHPLMGLLIKVVPYKIPNADEDSKQDRKIKPYLAQ